MCKLKTLFHFFSEGTANGTNSITFPSLLRISTLSLFLRIDPIITARGITQKLFFQLPHKKKFRISWINYNKIKFDLTLKKKQQKKHLKNFIPKDWTPPGDCKINLFRGRFRKFLIAEEGWESRQINRF